MRKKIFLISLFIVTYASSFAQWVAQNPPIIGFFSNIDFINSRTGFIAAGYEKMILKTTDSGNTWDFSYNKVGGFVIDIQIISSEIVYASTHHSLLKTANGGINWVEISYPISDLIYNIKFSSESNGFCIGANGKILKTTNGGLNWIEKNSNTGALLWDIWMLDTNNFIVCGGQWQSNYATILKSTNSGDDWISINTKNWGFFTNLFFVNKDTGFVTGGNLLKTTDAGNTWNLIPTGILGFNSIYFSSAKTGYAGIDTGIFSGAYHRISKSTDYGQTWKDIDSIRPFFSRALKFINDFTGWSIGETYIHKTSNGGSTFINTNSTSVPENFSLSQNYPNPFNPNTVISYKLSVAGNINLNLYNATGRLIKILDRGYKQAGNYEINFSAEGLSSGIYYYSLYADGILMDTKKAVLIK